MRIIRIEGGVAYIPLTKGREAVIDAADVPLIEGFNWYAKSSAHTIYAARNVYGSGSQVTVRMHRLLTSADAGLDVDHIDGDGLNNRRSNLRVVRRHENSQNQRLRSDSTTRLKGVCWHKRAGMWYAQIQAQKRKVSLGYFGCPTAAHFAYIKASRDLHGEFGRTA
jgi:hypothetical protein